MVELKSPYSHEVCTRNCRIKLIYSSFLQSLPLLNHHILTSPFYIAKAKILTSLKKSTVCSVALEDYIYADSDFT